MPGVLERQVAEFLRQRRGEMPYAEFSKLTRLPPSTLCRLEMCQQSITLGRLEQLLRRLKCRLADVFPDK